jgi:hypothetical protein
VCTPSKLASARARTTEHASVRLSRMDKQLWISQASPILLRFDGLPAAAARSPGNMPPAAHRQTVYAECRYCGYYSWSSARTYMLDDIQCVSNWVGLTESSLGIPNHLQISTSLVLQPGPLLAPGCLLAPCQPHHCTLPQPPPPWLQMVSFKHCHECCSKALHMRARLKGLRGG